MYQLTEQQIQFISDDIRTRGIAMASLQQDLLDHICCIIEHELETDGDFGRFYPTVITRFYRSELSEIESETVHLLTNKHYYTMKKVMISIGAISVAILSAGIILKFLHLPGASLFIVLGIVFLSSIFLPLMLVLKISEKQKAIDKVIVGVGTVSAILISVGTLFKIMHWPGANLMSLTALLIMIFVFIPVYFFTGIRNPQTKVNTTVSSIMMFTGCILILTLVRSPHGTRAEYLANTKAFMQSDSLVKNEKRLAIHLDDDSQGKAIYELCEELKQNLIDRVTLPEARQTPGKKFLLPDSWAQDYFTDTSEASQKLAQLEKLVKAYNQSAGPHLKRVSTDVFRLEDRLPATLNSLILMQMQVLQNTRELVAMK